MTGDGGDDAEHEAGGGREDGGEAETALEQEDGDGSVTAHEQDDGGEGAITDQSGPIAGIGGSGGPGRRRS